MFESAARREQESLRAELTQAVARRTKQLQLLKKQLQELQGRPRGGSRCGHCGRADGRPPLIPRPPPAVPPGGLRPRRS